MSEQTFLVFLQNTQTGEEFTAPIDAPYQAHEIAMGKVRQQYPSPRFKVHTAYSVDDLEQVIASLSRWPGLASSVQQGAKSKQTAVRVSFGEAVHQATDAVIEKKVESQKPEFSPATQTQSSVPSAISQLSQMKNNDFQKSVSFAVTPNVAPQPQTSRMSVIEQLKAMRSQ